MTDETMTMEDLQTAARRGKLRYRAFGEEHFYGVGRPFHGDLNRAAAMLPSAFETGLVRLYRDKHGLFLGPVNPELVDHNPLAGYEDETDE